MASNLIGRLTSVHRLTNCLRSIDRLTPGPVSTIHNVLPCRTVMYFKRMYPVKPFDPSRTGPFRPKLKRYDYTYIMEENTNRKPSGEMQVILATDIEGLGLKGDVVTVGKVLARTHMLSVGVAEYVNPDNLNKYEKIRKERANERRQTMTGLKTIKQLLAMTLPIPMSTSVPWQLNKTHVRVAFRNVGVELTDDCITLPEEPVTQHKTINFQITVNGMQKVDVRAIIYAYSKTVPASLPPVWSVDADATKVDIERIIADAAANMKRQSDKSTVTSTQ